MYARNILKKNQGGNAMFIDKFPAASAFENAHTIWDQNIQQFIMQLIRMETFNLNQHCESP
jgi:hypothetical protein